MRSFTIICRKVCGTRKSPGTHPAGVGRDGTVLGVIQGEIAAGVVPAKKWLDSSRLQSHPQQPVGPIRGVDLGWVPLT